MARPRSYDQNLRRSLLDACSEVISRHGPDGVSLRDLARRVGTSTAAVYALFGGREELLAAVTAEGFARFAEHLARVRPTTDPAGDLLALGLAYRDSALDDPHFYRVMFASAPASTPPPAPAPTGTEGAQPEPEPGVHRDRKSTRLNSSHVAISYAVFCLKK